MCGLVWTCQEGRVPLMTLRPCQGDRHSGHALLFNAVASREHPEVREMADVIHPITRVLNKIRRNILLHPSRVPCGIPDKRLSCLDARASR